MITIKRTATYSLRGVYTTRPGYPADLAASDWTQLADSPLTTDKKSAWAEYRQDLRDLTEASTPAAVIWPTAPAK